MINHHSLSPSGVWSRASLKQLREERTSTFVFCSDALSHLAASQADVRGASAVCVADVGGILLLHYCLQDYDVQLSLPLDFANECGVIRHLKLVHLRDINLHEVRRRAYPCMLCVSLQWSG